MSSKKLFAEVIRALLFVSRRIYELEMMVRILTSHKHTPRALVFTMFHLRGDEAHGQTNPGVIAQIRLRSVNQADVVYPPWVRSVGWKQRGHTLVNRGRNAVGARSLGD